MATRTTPRSKLLGDILRDWAATEPALTQAELARRLGVSRGTLSLWFTGRIEPSLSRFVALERIRPGLLERVLAWAKACAAAVPSGTDGTHGTAREVAQKGAA